MLTGPVFRFELARVSRKPKFFGARASYAFFVLVVLWLCYQSFWSINNESAASRISIRLMAMYGQSMFTSLATCQFLAACALTPALVAVVIAEEKQRKTLGCLLATPLASREIVLGKLGVRLLQVAVCFLLGLPIFTLIGLFGGIDPALALLVEAGTASSVFFLAAIAIVVSVYAKRTREAVSAAYCFAFLWFFIPAFAGWYVSLYWPRIYGWVLPVIEWIGATNPFSLLFTGLSNRAGLLEQALWMIGLQFGYGAVLIVLAVRRLRPVYRKQQDRVSRWAGLRKLSRLRLGRRPACSEADPVFWKERYVSDHHSFARLLGFLCCVGILGLAGYEWWSSAGSQRYDDTVIKTMMSLYLKISSVLIYVITALGVAVCAADTIASEREQDTWSGLIATPLDGAEILRAKMLAALWKFRFMLGLLAVIWLLGLGGGVLHPLGFVLGILELPIFLWFIVVLGTYHSMTAATASKAQGATIGTLMLLNSGLSCCGQFASVPGLSIMGCTPIILGGSLFGNTDLIRYTMFSAQGNEYLWSIAACLIGVAGYLLGACAYTRAVFHQFDERAGRPLRSRFSLLPVFAVPARSEPRPGG